MHRFRFGGLKNEGVYVDEDVRRMANTHQVVLGILIDSLLQQGDAQRALSVCKKWQQEMPASNVSHTEAALSMARCYYLTHHLRQADEIVNGLLRRSVEWLSWIETIKPSRRSGSLYTQYTWLKTMQQALALSAQYDRKDIYQQYTQQYEHYIKQYPNE